MRKGLLPEHFYHITLIGFEDDPPKGDEKDDKSGTGDEDGGDEDEEEDDDGSKGKGDAGDNDGLKSALQKERRERKRLEKEARDLRKFKEEAEAADKSDTDKAKDEATKSKAQNAKLANRLKTVAVDNAIIKLGGKLGFKDIDDALKLIDRDSIDIDQDEDEPDEIEIDEASVESALKKLAKAKPHLIGTAGGGSGEKSGSSFSKKGQPENDPGEAALRTKYAALQRSGHTS